VPYKPKELPKFVLSVSLDINSVMEDVLLWEESSL
jgi:hypothetical protein